MNINTNYNQLQQINNIWNMQLVDVLRMGSSVNSYAIALAKSRNQIMTMQLAELLKQCIIRDGNKWLEVVRRIVQNNYERGFQFTIGDKSMLQPLISGVYSLPTYEEKVQYYHKKIYQLLQYQLNKQAGSFLTVTNFQFYMQQALKNKNMQVLAGLLKILSNQFQTFIVILQPINNMNINECNIDIAWNLHENTILLLQNIIQIVAFMQEHAVKILKVLQFNNIIVPIKKIVENYLPIVVELLSTISILKNRQSSSPINLSTISSTRLLTLIQKQKTPVLTSYFHHLTNIILQVSNCSCLQLLLSYNSSLMNSLIKTQFTTNIVYLNNYSNLNVQLMALNEEINRQLYSDTLAGGWIRMIIGLNKNIGGYFNLYVKRIYQVFQSKFVYKMGGEQLLGYLLRICILNDPHIMRHRIQQMQKLLQATTDLFVSNWGSYSQWEQIQILHYFISFITKVQNAKVIGITSSLQQLISKCINLCLQCMSQQPDMLQQQNSQSNQLSPLHAQCHTILSLLPQSPSTLRLLTTNLQQILSQFFSFNNPSIKFLQLFHSYLIKIPDMVSRSSSLIIQYFYKAWMQEQQNLFNRSQGKQKVKGSMRLVRIAQIFATIISSDAQLTFEDVENMIVLPILSKLCKPYQIDYEQQLLEILQVLLSKHNYFTAQICLILSKLPIIFQKNHKKLSILRNIYLSLSLSNHIRNQILYQFPDLIIIMINMFITYVQEQLSVQQFMYYQDQVRKLFWSAQIFIQKFSPFILQNNQMIEAVGKILFQAVCKCYENTNKFIQQYSKVHTNLANSNIQSYFQFRELVLQLIFTISHMFVCTNIGYYSLPNTIALAKRTQITQIIYFQTIKMIPIVLIDQLLVNSQIHEQVMTDIIKFCQYMSKFEIDQGINKSWKNIEKVQQWDEWPKNTKDCVQNVLRQLRNRKKIDQFQHLQYLQAIQRFLR